MIAALRSLRRLPLLEAFALVASVLVIAVVSSLGRQAQAPPAVASYSSYDADAGGTRAFYELLQREGFRVERFERRAVFLDASLGTLVWIEPLDFDPAQRVPTPAEVAAVEAWVKAGGRFVYVGHDAVAASHGILKLPASTERAQAHGGAFVAPALRAAGVATLADGTRRRWQPAPGKRVLVADARGPLVLQYAYGRGTVVAVVDESLFSNDGIASADRARLAVALVSARAGAPIAFEEAAHGHFVPEHWWSIAPRGFVIAVVVASLALAIAFAGAAVRLGPPLVPVARDDASTSDFIDALAGLLQSGCARRDAMVAAADSTTRALARSFGLGDGATPNDVAARIGGDRETTYAEMLAVCYNGFASDANLVRGVALAGRLRKECATHVDRRR